MSLSIGIIGLPNVGKSTLFNALVKSAKAEASNYPFCTINPNIGIVEVPDERVQKIAEIAKSQKAVPTTIEFIDIAGLVKNAHKGEGLGNKFLSHIKETDAIAMVVRFFKDENVPHTANTIDPLKDIQTINLELILTDLAVVTKHLEIIKKDLKSGDNEGKKRLALLEKIKKGLDEEIPAWATLVLENPSSPLNPTPSTLNPLQDIQLLTAKPVLYIANVSEDDAATPSKDLIKKYKLQEILKNPDALMPISAKIESELTEFPEEEQVDYLKTLNLKESGLKRLIGASYTLLNLITFFTANQKEAHAWTLTKGSTAYEAAGKVHTDMQRGFIAAEVVHFDELSAYGSGQMAKDKGKIRTEGKDYIVQDGDIIQFRFNV